MWTIPALSQKDRDWRRNAIKNQGGYLLNKTEDRTKETRVFSAKVGNKDDASPTTSVKDRARKGLAFTEG